MFSALRSRLSYANVVATLALVFAMSGGALAASKFLITSTKQIKPSVLSQLKGRGGARGPVGPVGPAGPAGAQGPQGAQGAAGAGGKAGADGAAGESVVSAALNPGEAACGGLGGSKFTVGGKETTACNGAKGEPGEPGQPGQPGTTGFTKFLPKGETETGTWAALGIPPHEFYGWLVPISFSIPLKFAITNTEHAVVVRNCKYVESTEVAECEASNKAAAKTCPGTVEIPKAEAGALCLYQGYTKLPKEAGKESHLNVIELINPALEEGLPGVSTSGTVAFIQYEGPAEADVEIAGTWAVTAS